MERDRCFHHHHHHPLPELRAVLGSSTDPQETHDGRAKINLYFANSLELDLERWQMTGIPRQSY